MGFFISIGFFILLFSGCASQDLSPSPKVKIQETKSASQEIKEFKELSKKSSVPAMILPSVYQEISIFDNKSISFSAENANLRKILYTISEISGLNLVIDTDVDSDIFISLSIKEAQIKEALDVIMTMSGCYYVLQGNILHVKQYMQKSFFIPYVHSNTSFKTELGGDTLSSANSDDSGDSDGIKGSFELKYENPAEANNFYEQLEENIKALLTPEESETKISEEASGESSNKTSAGALTRTAIAAAISDSAAASTRTTAKSIKKNVLKQGGRYTLNRFSGVLNVYDKKKNVDAIEEMVNNIKKQSSKQVLVEAKILEIILNDGHQLGINWDAVATSVFESGDSLSFGQTLGLTGGVAATASYSGRSVNAVLTALDESGTVETLSNPRISVLSGQSAIISSGKLIPFWEKEVQITQGTGGSASTSEVTYNRRDVLDGLTMGVTPTVMEDGKIMLNIIPITSSIEDTVDFKNEDGVSVASAPIVNIKEAGTVIFARDDSLVMIGGLIDNTTSKDKQKVPLLGDIPFLGSLFSKTKNSEEKRELVILLRIKIIK